MSACDSVRAQDIVVDADQEVSFHVCPNPLMTDGLHCTAMAIAEGATEPLHSMHLLKRIAAHGSVMQHASMYSRADAVYCVMAVNGSVLRRSTRTIY